MDNRARAFFVGRGDCTLGRITRDADGNLIEKSSTKWEPNPEGGSVAICDVDPDTMQPVGAAEVYGDWDAANYLRRVLEKLEPSRDVNLPDFQGIIRRAQIDGVDICDYCGKYGFSCRDCIVSDWKGEPDNEESDSN